MPAGETDQAPSAATRYYKKKHEVLWLSNAGFRNISWQQNIIVAMDRFPYTPINAACPWLTVR